MAGRLRGYRKQNKSKDEGSMLRYIRRSEDEQPKTVKSDTTDNDIGSSTSPNSLVIKPPSSSKLLFVTPLDETEENSPGFSSDPKEEGINISAVLNTPNKSNEADISISNGSPMSTSSIEDVITRPKVRKRRLLSDSEDDGEPTPKKSNVNTTPSKFSPDMIDKLLNTYGDLYPNIDKMEIFDVIREVDYNFSALPARLDQISKLAKDKTALDKQHNKVSSSNQKEILTTVPSDQETANNSSNRRKKIRKAEKDKKKQAWKMKGKHAQEFEEEDEEDYIKDTKVYESESSDDEKSDSEEDQPAKTSARNAVMAFYNDACLSELTGVPGCSKKKAEIILSCRPFNNWTDTVKSFHKGRYISPELLNSAKDLLIMRDSISKLMKKCETIGSNMQSVVTDIIDREEAQSISEQPKTLNQDLKLKPYQLIGLNWLALMYHQDLNGVLADEMGLGKTIQSIAFLAYLKEKKELDKLCLIVVPSSTLENWAKELELWCPTMGVLFYHGSQDERRGMRAEIATGELDAEIDVILTTYNMVTSSTEDKGLFKKIPFHTVIFDEAHMLKNMASQRYENLMKIKTKHRVLLTGTPLQNNLVELMSILVFVMPDLFEGRKEQLKKIFSMFPKSDGVTDRAQYEKEKIDQAKKIMKPFFLRRLKQDVLKDLPAKETHVIKVPMSSAQHPIYKETVKNLSKRAKEIKLSTINDEDIVALTTAEPVDKSKMKQQKAADSSSNMLMTLRKLANHPLLIRSHYTEKKIEEMAKILKRTTHMDSRLDYVIEDLTWMSDFELHTTCRMYNPIKSYTLTNEQICHSGKFEQLDKMLPEMKKNGDRVLIFSQFVIMLDIIEEYMKIYGHSYFRLDGSTQVSDRQEMIDEFNEKDDIFVFLLSTRAGGLGINLTAANKVILHDIDFNPYNDRQAEDRCHRVGQTRSVSVHRFISKDTIEEGIFQIASQKLQLEKDVTGTEDTTNKADVLHLLKTALTS